MNSKSLKTQFEQNRIRAIGSLRAREEKVVTQTVSLPIGGDCRMAGTQTNSLRYIVFLTVSD
jgi:hypothetical protein